MNDADLLVRAARNMGAMWAHVAVASGGRVASWPDAIAADAGAPNPVLNRTTITDAAVDPADLTARVRRFYGASDRPWGIVDPWGSMDLHAHGFTVLARMPCMTLPADAAIPFEMPPDLRIEAVADETRLIDLKRALFDGFTLVPWPTDPAALFDRRSFQDPRWRLWVGYVDDEPVACSISAIGEGIVGVYLVAVRPDVRSRRFGEAISWAATRAESLPAVLQASIPGQPVYARMGYRVIGECVFWIPEP